MACVYFEGFDGITGTDFTYLYAGQYTAGGPVSPGSNGVTGQAYELVGGYGQNPLYFVQAIPSNTEYYMGFNYQPGGHTGGLMNFSNAGTSILQIGENSDGSITAYAGGGFTSIGSSVPGVWTAAVWQSFAIHVVVSATVGVVTVLINGVQVLNLTGLNLGTTAINQFFFLSPTNLFDGNEYNIFDDVWVFDTTGSHSNTFPVGLVTVQPLYPTAAGTYTQWTPNSGSNYSQVNATVSTDGTDFNYATTAGDIDTYDIGSLTGTISQVHACKVQAIIQKDAVPSKVAHTVLKSGSTLVEGSDISVPMAYTPHNTLYTDDPNTSAQWTTTNVNACEIGIKVIA